MKNFISSHEKRLWFWVLMVVVAIFSTLFIGRPLANQLRDQNVQAVFFVIALLLVAATVIIHGWKNKTKPIEFSIILGIAAVYLLLIFRLGAPERSHLIEYSVLAVFIHKALLEREQHKSLSLKPWLLAFLLTFFIGMMDECLQLFLSNRVFSSEDILFNGMAAAMAIGVSLLLSWAKKLT